MTFHFQHEWRPVVGQFVEVRHNFQVVRFGFVDAVTNDDQVLWLAPDGVMPRRMFSRADGYQVWIDYKWDTSTSKSHEHAGREISDTATDRRFAWRTPSVQAEF